MAHPVLLDVTRTLSAKSVETPTGIDRVERAYIRHFLQRKDGTGFLYRTTMLDQNAMTLLLDRVEGRAPWGRSDLRGIGRGLTGQIEADIRRVSTHQMTQNFTYLNVGHTNLDPDKLRTLQNTGARKTIALVHDMIPLDHPELQTPASTMRFAARMKALASRADLIAVNSAHTGARVAHWFGTWGSTPKIMVNHLGIDPALDVSARQFTRPAFVILGTIEPRKNHAVLLRVWDSLRDIPQKDRPQLHIIGRRGWMNEGVFKTLDTSPMMGKDIIEHGSLPDDQVAAILKGACALLFPSLTEGYGLPMLEAQALGVPTLVSDIPVFRELGGPLSLYLNPFDATVWRKEIIKQTQQGHSRAKTTLQRQLRVPVWSDHFALLEQHL